MMIQEHNPTSFDEFVGAHEKICVVGLGYVGLPLAVALSKHFPVVGLDINSKRVLELRDGIDVTREISPEVLKTSQIEFTSKPEALAHCPIVIIAVPTPVDEYKIPDLTPVREATAMVARHMGARTVVVYESTVYPGVTEEVCVPIIERVSGRTWKSDFHVGYSPERVNPGDREHTVERIMKVVSGDTPETLELLSQIYGKAIQAGIHKASSIKTAEAAKVIENTQRDLNIALINELAMVFGHMGLDTRDVLAAAGTKWNFLRFEPGLVGGHCIGVDPYYLTYKAESFGYHPRVILAGRQINDSMGKYIAEMTVKRLLATHKVADSCRVLVLGLSFKENIGDIRNSKVIDIYRELKEYGVDPAVYDPYADAHAAHEEYGIKLLDQPEAAAPYDAVIVAVKHREFAQLLTGDWYKAHSRGGRPVIMDVKGLHDREEMIRLGFTYWRL